MNRSLFVIMFAAVAASASAQTQPTTSQGAPDPGSKIVAVVNGETISAAKLDQLWNRAGAQMRAQYEKTGGKVAFLDNYLRKRLLVQEALKSGFDKRPDVQADMQSAAEGALFDRYIRDVVASSIVSDKDVRAYYDEHQSEFQQPEMVKVRHIVVVPNGAGPRPKTQADAMEEIQRIAGELRTAFNVPPGTDPNVAKRVRANLFAQAAQKYSEDASAQSGGDLGWSPRGLFDPKFEDAAFNLPVGVLSGIIETRFGYHLIFVEDKKPAAPSPFDQVKQDIREALLGQRAADVMQAVTKLTNELSASSKVAIYPENVK